MSRLLTSKQLEEIKERDKNLQVRNWPSGEPVGTYKDRRDLLEHIAALQWEIDQLKKGNYVFHVGDKL